MTVDIQTWSFLLGCHCSRLSVARKKKVGGGLDGFVAAREGKQEFVRASQWLEQVKKHCYFFFGCLNAEYVHVSTNRQNAETQTFF